MVFTKEYKFPSDEELKVEECPLGSPYIRAGAHHLGKYCEAQNNEFMLCRHETRDPIKCLPEGKVVTSCTNEFFRKVKASCGETFTQYAMCLEQSMGMENTNCRGIQAKFDTCMKDSLGMDRPPLGYFSLIRVHESDRPVPKAERPAWLDDPRGVGGRADGLPKDFPRNDHKGKPGWVFGL